MTHYFCHCLHCLYPDCTGLRHNFSLLVVRVDITGDGEDSYRAEGTLGSAGTLSRNRFSYVALTTRLESSSQELLRRGWGNFQGDETPVVRHSFGYHRYTVPVALYVIQGHVHFGRTWRAGSIVEHLLGWTVVHVVFSVGPLGYCPGPLSTMTSPLLDGSSPVVSWSSFSSVVRPG